ncbi:MAG: HAMP domain-containing histidine kinase [Bacteroidetes bacterium]|nr:HAMP domain-containing histidine kinase [Bacteroidota bacterium]
MELQLLIVLLLQSENLSTESYFGGSWALFFYVLALASLTLGVLNWRSKSQNKEKKALEALVKSQKDQLAESLNTEKLNRDQLLRLTNELNDSRNNFLRCNNELLVAKKNLQNAHLQLIESEKMASLGQLTAGIAHEINNPINFISGGVQALEILQNEILDKKELTGETLEAVKEDLKELMKSINNGVSRTATIIKSLKTFSSPVETIDASGRMDVKECAENAIILVGSKLIENSIKVKRNFMHRSGAYGNSSQICQVLINMLDNSIYALLKTNREKAILIETSDRETEVIIKIKDNGSGIPKNVQERIFEPFFTTKDVGFGTGLGLSICHSILEKHNGKIDFTSSEDQGTEFTISLPKGEPIQIW